MPSTIDQDEENVKPAETDKFKQNMEAVMVTNAMVEKDKNVDTKDKKPDDVVPVLVEKSGGNKKGPEPDIMPVLVHNPVPHHNIRFEFA